MLETIKNAGFEAYFVGGFVRDYMLGIDSYDVDITTNAHPEDVVKLFDKVIPTGIKHGTVTVVVDDQFFEVTTYRSESNYSDNRKPDNVEFGVSLEEDLKRRDFTINALVMDEHGEVYDYQDGLPDLMLKKIKTIGDPNERFKEDSLRMLRAIRFQSKLGFKIEEKTYQAIIDNKELLINISIERIKKELLEMFKGKYLKLAIETINKIDFPNLPKVITGANELSPVENLAVMAIENNLDLLKWKFSKVEQKFIKETALFIDSAIDEYAIYLHKNLESKIKVFEFITGNEIANYCMIIKKELPIYSRDELCLNGDDLKDAGFLGKEIGELLEEAEKAVVYKLISNDKKSLLEYVRRPRNDRNNEIASRSRSNNTCESK